MHWHFEREHLCTEMLRCSDGEYENFCYILWEREERTAVLIDPAWEPAKFEDLIDQLQLQVKSVLLTHSHPDHLHLADYMATRYQVPAWISATEYEYYQPILDHVNLWQSSDKLQWDRLAIEVIPTPGHTQGGLCFVAGDFAFTGDTLFAEGCGNCHASGGDPVTMFASLQLLKSRLQAQQLIFPGHTYGLLPGLSYAEVQQKNIYLNISREADFVRFRMRNVRYD